MCVIQATENSVITSDVLEAGYKENPWGTGVAWIDKDESGAPLVRWRKGMTDIEEVKKLVATLKPPYVVHHRIPTEGLDDLELTHPFPISAGVENFFDGETKGLLLFHNGGWGEWRRWSMDTCKAMATKLPKGMLSDSRMMAWHAYHYGEEILQLINEKVLVFGLNDDGTVHFQIYGMDRQNGWNFKGDRQTVTGVWYSNDRWEKNLPKVYTNLRDIVKNRGGNGGDRHQTSFRPEGDAIVGSRGVSGRNDSQESVEGSEKTVHLGSVQGGSEKLANNPEFLAKLVKVHPSQDELAWAMQLNPKKFGHRRVAGFLASATIVH